MLRIYHYLTCDFHQRRRPARWLEVRIGAEKREPDKKFVPFSKNVRGCTRKELATLRIAKAVVAMLKV
jgi:hypothetical protein